METDGNREEITNPSETTNSIHGFFLSLFHFTSFHLLFFYLVTRIPLKINRVLPLLPRMVSEIVNSKHS